MNKNLVALMLFVTFCVIGLSSCSEDEATIVEKLPGTWVMQTSQFNKGLALQAVGGAGDISESIKETVESVLSDCKLKFNGDGTGSIAVKLSLGLPIPTQYAVTGDNLQISTSLISQELKFVVVSISDTDMELQMKLADVASLASTVNASNETAGIDVASLIAEITPLIGMVEDYAKQLNISLDKLGLGVNPTVSLFFKR